MFWKPKEESNFTSYFFVTFSSFSAGRIMECCFAKEDMFKACIVIALAFEVSG